MKYLMTFSYDGTNFSGYQKQKNKRTVEEEIEKCLTKINSNKGVVIHATGRTDALVHAINQKAHFDMESDLDLEATRHSINSLLPNDIYIKSLETVLEDFHARYNVKSKTYLYKMNLGEYNPIERNYVYQYNDNLDIKAMEEASKILIGTHNFKAFTKSVEEKLNYERTIYSIVFSKNKDILEIRFSGSGFLRYMIRNIVGTLIDVGEHKKSTEEVKKILGSQNRENAGKTANPEGLYLENIFY